MDDLPESAPPNQPPSEPPPSSTSPTQDPRIVHRCTSCGAGLRHQHPYCVYCGTRCDDVPAPTATPTRPFEFSEPPTPTFIPPNALCRSCGYSLDGLKVSDNCPECGRPVLDSIRGDLLKYSDPNYLQTLQRGVVFIEIGLVVYVFTTVATGLLSGRGPLSGSSFALAGERIASVIDVIPAILLFVGWYLLSTPDPGIGLQDKGDRARQNLRFAVIANAIASLISGVAGASLPGAVSLLLKSQGGTTPPTIDIVMVILVLGAQLGAFITFVIQFFVGMTYLHWLARRVPDMLLVNRMKTQIWIIVLLYFPVGCLTCGLSKLASLILYYLILDKFRRHFISIREAMSSPSQSPNSVNNP